MWLVSRARRMARPIINFWRKKVQAVITAMYSLYFVGTAYRRLVALHNSWCTGNLMKSRHAMS